MIQSFHDYIATGRDTTEEARLALNVMITNTLVIVTSASHIPRAVTIFKKALRPAPCDYQMAGHPPFRFRIWSLPLPSVDEFDKSQRMVYEWLGNVFEGDGE
jgi:uncharacterized SAM-binding protein YcdF (DUF218 family)